MATMIDWVTARLPLAYGGPINGGSVVSISPDGEVEWRTDRRLPVVGSHASQVMVRGGFGALDFSGNPAKFLQGHNLFGSADLRRLMVLTMERVTGELGVRPSAADRDAWARGDFELSRIDATRMIDCETATGVTRVLGVISHVGSTKFQRPVAIGSTVYIGQKSRRQSLKFYDKAAEMLRHPLPATLAPDWHHALAAFAEGKVRAELTLGSKWFHDNAEYRRARWWDASTPGKLLDERLAVLEVSDTMRLADNAVMGLPSRLVPVYDAWRAGRDLRAVYSRPTFYRYRRQLLDLANIDIAKVQPRLLVTENEYLGGEPVGPLLRGPGAEIPEWAHGTPLLAS